MSKVIRATKKIVRATIGFSEADTVLDPNATDHQPQIQTIIDQVLALGGGTIYVRGSSNIYKLGHELMFIGASTSLSSNILFKGDGMGATYFKLNDEVNREMIVVGNGNAIHDGPRDDGVVMPCNNISFQGFTLDGNKANQTSADPAYPVAGTRNLLRYRSDALTSNGGYVKDVFFYRGKQNGLSIESHKIVGVEYCRAEENEVFGLWGESGGRWSISKFFTKNNVQAGIKIFGSGMASIYGCVSEADVGGGIFIQNSSRISVRGNVIRDAGINHASTGKPAISLSGADRINVIANDIQTPYGDGIEVTGSSVNNQFIGNDIQDASQRTTNTYSSVHFGSGTNSNNTFIGNTYKATASNKPKHHYDDDNANATPNKFIGDKLLDTVSTSKNGMASANNEFIAVTGIDPSVFTTDISVPDEAYGSGWNGSLEVPTKNAVYDKIQTLLGSTAYTPTNVTTDRSYDANATTTEELADVVGTLITDLQGKGILG